MIRATTPTHIFCFCDINPEETFKTILITYAQNDDIVLEKNKDDLAFESKVVEGETKYFALLRLTQEETKMFSSKPNASIVVQLRALSYDNSAVASNKIKISLQDVLNDEVLI